MNVDFPYPGYRGIAPVEIPDDRLMGIYAPKALPDTDEEKILQEGLTRPYEAPRLRHMLGPGSRVLILFDDGTRVTPIHRLLPYIVHELAAAGVPDSQVKLLSALGTHRPMSEAELQQKLGLFRDRFEVHQHEWLNDSQLHEFGRTSDGTRVTANRLMAECNFVLGLGAIVPHRVKGLSGGAKIAFPGVSGKEMMFRNQWEASMQMSETVMGVAENSMRLRMEEAARIAGLKYIVNLVQDRDDRIVGCFAGEPVRAHREGGKLAREICGVRMPERADIVIIDAYPADRDFWQSAKGAYAGTMAVRDGGTLILVAPNPEGVANNHPNLMAIGYRPHAEIVRMVQSGQIED
ncbi:MAG: nickel-dependent lactate racemase, partial [Phycisphaerae bacterium]